MSSRWDLALMKVKGDRAGSTQGLAESFPRLPGQPGVSRPESCGMSWEPVDPGRGDLGTRDVGGPSRIFTLNPPPRTPWGGALFSSPAAFSSPFSAGPPLARQPAIHSRPLPSPLPHFLCFFFFFLLTHPLLSGKSFLFLFLRRNLTFI